MRLHYLDDYRESGSTTILKQLGVLISQSSEGLSNIDNLESYGLEHTTASAVTYRVTSGSLAIDIRDSADCFLRCILEGNEALTIPGTVSRRLLNNSSGNEKCVVLSDIKLDEKRVRFSNTTDSIGVIKYHNARELVCELCQQFFVSGWVTGTGGSISIRHGNRIYMTPSGVQKERIKPDELYVLDVDGNILATPQRKSGSLKPPILSDCAQLFLHAYKQRNAGAVLHSHGIQCALATCLFEGQSEFRISHQEMIKGIAGHGYFDQLVVPIIENTAFESQLSDLLGATIAKYPKTVSVLVRRHGMYVWGDTWEAAKRHAESLHYLFDVALNMKRMGIDFLSPPPPVTGSTAVVPSTLACQRGSLECSAACASSTLSGVKHLLLDIEGTTTPITFVKDILFPYASKNVESYLNATWQEAATQQSTRELVSLAGEMDSEAALAVKSLENLEAKDKAVPLLAAFVRELIQKDVKAGALKGLQGRMWLSGYVKNEFKSVVYEDVVRFLRNHSELQINIFSSGSREAQKLLFKYSNHGDVRSFISCYFDISSGNSKRDAVSYKEISLSLGVDSPDEILFITDVFEEAEAARIAGLRTLIAVRPGNAKLPEGQTHRTIQCFDEI